ncbi:MAG: phosphoglycolate phosphatase [Gammaproteobacteria bacterium]|nr:MAG: phosphoglycolate phosphatase [Gammaproteobacteria bacterium]
MPEVAKAREGGKGHPAPQAILFDLDGTLVDSVPDLACCIDRMLLELGLSPAGEEKVRQWVGDGAERLVARALTGELEGEPDPELFRRAFDLFSRCYLEQTGNSRLYPGAREALERLGEAGLRLGCVTNKRTRFTLPLLEALGIDRHFDIVVCGDTLEEKKPHPAPLLHAVRNLESAPPASLMVGDSANDITAARAAGMPVAAVTYGYYRGGHVGEARPDHLLDNLLELCELV